MTPSGTLRFAGEPTGLYLSADDRRLVEALMADEPEHDLRARVDCERTDRGALLALAAQIPLRGLGLSARAWRACWTCWTCCGGAPNLAQLADEPPHRLGAVQGCGSGTLGELAQTVERFGLMPLDRPGEAVGGHWRHWLPYGRPKDYLPCETPDGARHRLLAVLHDLRAREDCEATADDGLLDLARRVAVRDA